MRNAHAGMTAACALLAGCTTVNDDGLGLASLEATGEVDERFLSYNVEMVEVTGGRFWRPYGSEGSDPFEYRPPMDLADPKLRQLAAALGPAYIRVSGTWANATWFADAEEAPEAPPPGFDSILTHQQWRDVIGFAQAVDGEIVTSFATSPGARDEQGNWTSAMAARWIDFTRAEGGRIAAAEFANEPNMLSLTQPPEGYTAERYRADYARFAEWLRAASPTTLLLAPGIAELNEPFRTLARANPQVRVVLENEEMIAADSPTPDRFTFHYYSSASQRCGQLPGFDIGKATSLEHLASIDAAIGRIGALRDATAPRVPLWNTETGEAACGGNPWAKTFADTFRFVDTLGRSAQGGVAVFMHNTLAASDYGLLDENTHDPRPNYWVAVLWNRLMGTQVLAPPASPSGDLLLYAHCQRGTPGGVAFAAINIGEDAVALDLGSSAQAWHVTATAIDSPTAMVNGSTPSLGADGALVGLDPIATAGQFTVTGRSIAFFAAPAAGNAACT
jgi:hypothetical protein